MSKNGKRKNFALVLSEQTFPVIEQITMGMPGGFFIYHADSEEKLIYANQALVKMYGCRDLEEFKAYTGYTFPGLIHPDDLKKTEKEIHQQIEDHNDNLDYVEYRIIRKDGEIRWIDDYGYFVHTDIYGDVFCVFLEDVTERHREREKATENELLVQEKTKALSKLEHETTSLCMIHEMLGSGMWTMEFDRQGNMESVHWSDEFRRMLGYKGKEDFPDLLESWSDLLHEEDKERVLKEYYDTIADYTGEKTYDVEYQLLTKNQGYRWYRATGRLSRREDGTPITYVGMFVDITAKKQLDQELKTQRRLLEDALERAQQANRAKTIFLNNMSHDIRTPMNAIIGFTTLASMYIENKDLVKDYLTKIMTSSNHLLALINDVLDMSRIESGKVQLEEAEYSLSDIMHDLKTITQTDILAKQMDFYIDTLDVSNELIICDRLKLSQVLLNIVNNALKFTPPKGIITVRVSEQTGAPEGYACYEFRIRDTGIGMSPEFLTHIFEPFEREKTSTVSGTTGTGLGMTITKNIVDMMDGTISVESEEGKGTEFILSFTFRLPDIPRKTEKIPELSGLRALVAANDYSTCGSVTKMLGSIGIRFEWTTSGKEAILRAHLAKEQNDPFQVCILDWTMNDIEGIDAARQIRKVMGDDKTIIMLTSYDGPEIEEEAQKAGVLALCSKPLFLSELRNMLIQSAHAGSAKKSHSWISPEVYFEGKNILLAEDNELNQEIAVTILEEAGFHVDVACDGTIAVEKIKSSAPGTYDIILMDIQMPLMDGYKAARTIRGLENPKLAGIPIIAMTANAFAEDRQQAIDAGMNGHLGKPIEIDKLMETLRKIFM